MMSAGVGCLFLSFLWGHHMTEQLKRNKQAPEGKPGRAEGQEARAGPIWWRIAPAAAQSPAASWSKARTVSLCAGGMSGCSATGH